MADCECLKGCPFFNDRMKDTTGLGAIYKKRYCQGDNSQCARYRVMTALGKGSVPADVYPNMQERAQQLVGAG